MAGACLFEELKKEFDKDSANQENSWYPMLNNSMTLPKVTIL
jgi:hypothetical protein